MIANCRLLLRKCNAAFAPRTYNLRLNLVLPYIFLVAKRRYVIAWDASPRETKQNLGTVAKRRQAEAASDALIEQLESTTDRSARSAWERLARLFDASEDAETPE